MVLEVKYMAQTSSECSQASFLNEVSLCVEILPSLVSLVLHILPLVDIEVLELPSRFPHPHLLVLVILHSIAHPILIARYRCRAANI